MIWEFIVGAIAIVVFATVMYLMMEWGSQLMTVFLMVGSFCVAVAITRLIGRWVLEWLLST